MVRPRALPGGPWCPGLVRLGARPVGAAPMVLGEPVSNGGSGAYSIASRMLCTVVLSLFWGRRFGTFFIGY